MSIKHKVFEGPVIMKHKEVNTVNALKMDTFLQFNLESNQELWSTAQANQLEQRIQYSKTNFKDRIQAKPT